MNQEFSIGRVGGHMIAAVRGRTAAFVLVVLGLYVAPAVLWQSGLLPQAQTSPLALLTSAVMTLARESILGVAAAAVALLAIRPDDRRPLAGQAQLLVNALPVLVGLQLLADGPRLVLWAVNSARAFTASLSMTTIFIWFTLTISLWALVYGAYLAFALPAALDERLGLLASLRRSWRLTYRRRWLMLGLMLIWMVVAGIALFTVNKAIFGFGAGQSADVVLYRRVTAGINVVVTVLRDLFVAATFVELRRLVDPPAQETAAVFD